VAQCLRVGGVLAVGAGRPELAVRLCAAAQTLSPSPNGTDVPVEHDLAAALETARGQLGERKAAREWTLGSGAPVASALRQLRELISSVESASPTAG